MKQIKEKWDSILWVEAIGFSVIIALSWLVEAIHVPHLIYGEPFIPNWHRALLRTFVMFGIWSWVHLLNRRMLKRLHYLEEFLRVCSWCRKVCDHEKWLTMEEYFDSKFDVRTTHGVCPECMKIKMRELDEKESMPMIPE